MEYGSFGDVIFTVSADKIQTIRDLTRQGAASIQSHKRHLDADLPEFTGVSGESFGFSIRLSKYLGVEDPTAVLEILIAYMREGIPQYLILGTGAVGRYKWLVSGYKVVHEHFDGNGNPVTIDVTISLTEYPRK